MKLALKITGIFLIVTLLTSCVVATENKDLPTKKEITDFITEIPVSDDYINTVFDAVKNKQPTWNCDTWVDKKTDNQILSLYYVNPYSAEGYGSIYFNEFGKEISKQGIDLKLVNHYVGKAVSEENTDNTLQTADETLQTTETTGHMVDETGQTSDETDQTSESEEKLAEYEGKLAEYEDKLANLEEETKKVRYEGQSDKYEFSTASNESQSAEDMAKTVDDAAHIVENAAKTVETVAKKVEEEEETKQDKEIRNGILITVVGGIILSVIVSLIKLFFK
ncbi:hypothetical protein MSBR3_2260 [Methanosarcina barkeri 3]|uniref:Uncharacterized protein n=1 Tax=Methanosarcina barkeri 3 TaxID=1434107 RepID=A0A0E3SNM7_METBA|nr:hypothetical protein [Methanosarcina barkeri]AKB82838.1 hypothetical protein MSBR3_2260 [Methanosarcina barkeri 3]